MTEGKNIHMTKGHSEIIIGPVFSAEETKMNERHSYPQGAHTCRREIRHAKLSFSRIRILVEDWGHGDTEDRMPPNDEESLLRGGGTLTQIWMINRSMLAEKGEIVLFCQAVYDLIEELGKRCTYAIWEVSNVCGEERESHGSDFLGFGDWSFTLLVFLVLFPKCLRHQKNCSWCSHLGVPWLTKCKLAKFPMSHLHYSGTFWVLSLWEVTKKRKMTGASLRMLGRVWSREGRSALLGWPSTVRAPFWLVPVQACPLNPSFQCSSISVCHCYLIIVRQAWLNCVVGGQIVFIFLVSYDTS